MWNLEQSVSGRDAASASGYRDGPAADALFLEQGVLQSQGHVLSPVHGPCWGGGSSLEASLLPFLSLQPRSFFCGRNHPPLASWPSLHPTSTVRILLGTGILSEEEWAVKWEGVTGNEYNIKLIDCNQNFTISGEWVVKNWREHTPPPPPHP